MEATSTPIGIRFLRGQLSAWKLHQHFLHSLLCVSSSIRFSWKSLLSSKSSSVAEATGHSSICNWLLQQSASITTLHCKDYCQRIVLNLGMRLFWHNSEIRVTWKSATISPLNFPTSIMGKKSIRKKRSTISPSVKLQLLPSICWSRLLPVEKFHHLQRYPVHSAGVFVLALLTST